MTETLGPFDLRPVEDPDNPGFWDALDEAGYGYPLGLPSADHAQAWIDGYAMGARENM